MISTNLIYLVLTHVILLLSSSGIQALEIGKEVCISGYVMDRFCINRGTLLDNPSVVTLEDPDQHSYHCLLDVGVCIGSGYEILLDPVNGQTLYTPGVRLDGTGNQLALDVGRAHGAAGTCSTCTEELNSNSFGFRATAIGKITDLGDSTLPPTLAVMEFGAETDLACPENIANMAEMMEELPIAQNSVTEEDITTESDPAQNVEDNVIGKEVCISGYLMDRFCIDRGTFLDNPSLRTLEEPDKHSYHCLLDVDVCVASGYEILLDPENEQKLYTPGVRLDAKGSQLALDAGRAYGAAETCTTCTGELTDSNSFGFRATAIGKITDIGNSTFPPTLAVMELGAETDLTCPVNIANIAEVKEELPITQVMEEETIIGKEVCISGYVMDRLCINRGTLLDNPSVVTLEDPDKHSYHCLLDVGICVDSGYEILLDPVNDQTLYTPGIRLDAKGNQLVLDVGRAHGKAGTCSTCTEELNSNSFGFRATVIGTITDLGDSAFPPTLAVMEFGAETDLSCPENIVNVAEIFEDFPIAQDAAESDSAQNEDCEGGSDNPDYDRMVPLLADDELVFYYSIVDDTSISAQLVYRGTGWVALGVSPDGQMVGGEVVIGLPDDPNSENNPGKYSLSQRSAAGINLSSAQTLKDATIVQDSGITTLTFTKLLQEAGEHTIDPNNVNTFIWAVGSSNSLNYHRNRSPFDLDLSQSCGAPPTLISSPQAVPISYWKAHGILAGFSWGLLTPLAIASSVHRSFFKGGLWFKAHYYLNMATILCTITAFSIAVAAYQKGGVKHFNGKHQMLGLIMFIVLLIHSIGAMLRPHVEQDVEKTRIRKGWEIAHRGMGYFLFIASIYQVQKGLELYAQRSGNDYRTVYWIWLSIYGVVNLMLSNYIRIRKSSSA